MVTRMKTRWLSPMAEDPWSGIAPPERASLINARRVSQSINWGLYWAVDADRNVLLILQHGSRVGKSRRLPTLRGLCVESQPVNEVTERLVIRLADREQREVFHRFCQDIIGSTAMAKTESQAVERFLARTWRWHWLLRSGNATRLGDEKQKGLIGELVVLERHLLPVLAARDAVRCWTGPMGAHQDFQISRVHVEAKARASGAPRVIISSEHQLDCGDDDTLFLHVTEVATATEYTPDAFNFAEYANKICSMIAEYDMVAADLFEERLSAVGFDGTHDYSDQLWVVVRESLFHVREAFPRIISEMLPEGVNGVCYAISLHDCEAFRVELAALSAVISGETNVA